MSASKQPTWILDSGASKHFSGVKSDFIQLKRWSTNRTVRIANNTTVFAEGYGTVKVADYQLKDVWYVPQFKSTRLLSVKALAQEGCTALFESDHAICRRGETVLFEATISGRSYIVTDTAGAFYTAQIPPKQLSASYPNIDATKLLTIDSNIELWHRRLAHTNMKDVEKLEKASFGMKLGQKPPRLAGRHTCILCLAGKMKETFSKTTDSRSPQNGQRLHGDTSGRMGTTFRGFNYFLLVVDDASRYTWIRLLKTLQTDEVLAATTDILLRIERHTGKKAV